MEIDLDKPIEIKQEIVCHSEYYTEGPVLDDEGGFFFTTLTGGKIAHCHRTYGLTTRKFDGWPNGQTLTKKGLVVCDSKNSRLVQLDKNGKFLENLALKNSATQPIRSPNDVIEDVYGGLYFTDSVREDGRVFYRSPNKEIRIIADQLDYPNGLALTKDNRYLIIAESYKNRLIQIELESAGFSKRKEILCTLPHHPSGRIIDNLPDGIAIDQLDRIWIAHYGMGAVQIVDRLGNLIKSIPTGIPLTSNICFSAKNTLFVTGGHGEPGPGAVIKITLTNT